MEELAVFSSAPIILLAVFVVFVLVKGAIVVPNQTAVIIERFGRYHKTLLAGFHVIIPFVDRQAYRRSLKENVLDVPAQTCITSDNVSVSIDGVIYLQVVDPQKSAYGISDFVLGAVQLAQTSLRSSIGRMALDKTFESRDHINQEVCSDLNAATAAWGVKVLRYEIRDLTPPRSIMEAMERQVKAEREKRAVILQSEGEKQSKINIAEGERASAIARSEGEMQALINRSEGEKQSRINLAEGDAQQILRIAQATADGLASVKVQLDNDAVAAAQLKLAEQYIEAFSQLAKQGTQVIIPADVASVGGMIGTITGMLRPGQGLNAASPAKPAGD